MANTQRIGNQPPVLAGISFPFRIANQGLPCAAFGVDVVGSALKVLLRTPKGSRVMRPTLGHGLQKLIFENNGPTMEALVQKEVLDMISNFLPQVKIIALNFAENQNKITVDVKYSVQGIVDTTGPTTIGNKN